ncbi:MAG: ACT domain-containing protein, partial [Flavobacteriaceae bacterium]
LSACGSSARPEDLLPRPPPTPPPGDGGDGGTSEEPPTGLVNEVTNLISNAHNVDISQIHFDTENGTFTGDIKLHVRHASTLYMLVSKLKKVPGIDKVVRD